MTETTQERRSAQAITGNNALQNSLAIPLEKATGMNPAQVMRVPVSMGFAVARKAKQAASKRSRPRSSCTLIISTAMMASSTSKPREMIKEPKETL